MTEQSAGTSNSSFPGIIQWPCGDRPHRKTLRAFFAWRETVAVPAGYFAAFVIAPLLWGAIFHFLFRLEAAFGVAALSVPGLVVWIIYYVIMVIPLRRVFANGPERTAAWRADWLRLESLSTSFRERVREAASKGSEVSLDEVPWLPNLRWHLLEYQDNSPRGFDTDGMAKTELDSIKRKLLADMASHLSSLAEDVVIFRTNIDGVPAVGCCCMVAPNLQLWATYSTRMIGNSMIPRIQSGIQWWAGRIVLNTGETYPGDTWKYKVKTLDLTGGMLFCVLAYLLVPPLGMFGAAAIVIMGSKSVVRQILWRDRARMFAEHCHLDGGDSTDLQLLQSHRGLTGYGVSPLDGVKVDYQSLQTDVVTLSSRVTTSLRHN